MVLNWATAIELIKIRPVLNTIECIIVSPILEESEPRHKELRNLRHWMQGDKDKTETKLGNALYSAEKHIETEECVDGDTNKRNGRCFDKESV